MQLTLGQMRHVTKEENERYKTNYSWVVIEPYIYEDEDKKVEVPAGFLCDGSTMSPDFGVSWLIHDYLYATHQFADGSPCQRVEADAIMINILLESTYNYVLAWVYSRIYANFVKMISATNIFWAFTSAWESSGTRGAETLQLSDN